MYQTHDQTNHPSDVNPLVGDRIHDLYATSSELRAARHPKPTADATGLLTRTRWTIGRRLISIGSAVAGQHA